MTDFVITTENAADLPEEFIRENEIGILSVGRRGVLRKDAGWSSAQNPAG